ncbi:MAG: ABC transporter permease [Saprospiraceae bacterium]|nr:ABC transporter permease [Saprospiraceae bacterium]
MRRHKLRTFLTALSVFWGILMLIILVGAGSGLENSAEYNFQDDAVNSIWIFRGRTSMPYKGLPPGRFIQFTNDDYNEVDKNIDEVDHLTARYYLSGDVVIGYKQKSLSYRVIGVHPDHQILENTNVVQGRYINDKDIAEGRKVCLIGDVVKKALFPDTSISIIGEPVTIGGIQYTVVGEYTDQRADETRIVYVPISTCQKIFAGSDRIHQLMMTVGDATFAESKIIEGKVRQLLADHHNFDVNDDQAIYVNNDLENYQEFRTVIGFIKGFIWFVGIGSIIAGVIGVSNIMLIIVKDRTREIGIRKALGATPRSIVSMILQESIFITAIAGYMGLLVGFGIVYGINALMLKYKVEAEYFRDPQVNFGVVIMAMLILVISGALAGLLPAIKAARINPVVAMKA